MKVSNTEDINKDLETKSIEQLKEIVESGL